MRFVIVLALVAVGAIRADGQQPATSAKSGAELLRELEKQHGTDQETLRRKLVEPKIPPQSRAVDRDTANKLLRSLQENGADRRTLELRAADMGYQLAPSFGGPVSVDTRDPQRLAQLRANAVESQSRQASQAESDQANYERWRRGRQLWTEGGAYDKTFTPEELLQQEDELNKLNPAERQAAVATRAKLNRDWAAGQAQSQRDVQRQRQRQQQDARDAYWARQQWIEDQVEINNRAIDYLTRPYIDENGVYHLRGKLSESIHPPRRIQ
jgi:hypothetical protein